MTLKNAVGFPAHWLASDQLGPRYIFSRRAGGRRGSSTSTIALPTCDPGLMWAPFVGVGRQVIGGWISRPVRRGVPPTTHGLPLSVVAMA